MFMMNPSSIHLFNTEVQSSVLLGFGGGTARLVALQCTALGWLAATMRSTLHKVTPVGARGWCADPTSQTGACSCEEQTHKDNSDQPIGTTNSF